MSAEVEIKLFLQRDHMINESRDLRGEIASPYITKVLRRATELINKNIYLLQIGAALFYYKLEQTLLQIRATGITK